MTEYHRFELPDYPLATHLGDDGLARVACANGDLILFHSGKLEVHSLGSQVVALAAAFDPKGARVLFGCDDGRARLFDWMSKEVVELEADAAWVEHVVFSKDGQRIALSSGKTAKVFDQAAKQIRTSSVQPSTVAALAFAPDAKSLALARYGGVELLSLDGSPDKVLEWKSSMVSLCFHPQNKYLAAGCQDHSLHFWRLPEGQDSKMDGYPTKPKSLVFNQDGSLLASSGGNEVICWNFRGRGPEGTNPIVLQGHQAAVQTVVAAQSDQRVISGGKDGALCVFRPNRGNTPSYRATLPGSIEQLSIAPNGKAILAASSNGIAAIFAPS